MQNSTNGVQEMEKILNLLHNVKDYITIEDFYKSQLSGDKDADALLIPISKMILDRLKNDKIIKIDNSTAKNTKIYGLTEKGIQMYRLFKELAYKK